jgi:hypothetical protein
MAASASLPQQQGRRTRARGVASRRGGHTRKPSPRGWRDTREACGREHTRDPDTKLAELPDELRRSVPPLAFGGAIYSEVRAQRMVILNGQLLREGEALSADLTLETIRANSAVLRIKGERYELVI